MAEYKEFNNATGSQFDSSTVSRSFGATGSRSPGATGLQPSGATISQQGIVRSIKDGYAQVDISAASACAACRVNGSCPESKAGRSIQVCLNQPGNTHSDIREGDLVMVTTGTKQGLIAVLFLFILPLVLIVGGVAWAHSQGWDDAAGAGLGLGIAALYGVALWLLNAKIQTKVSVNIEKLTNPRAVPQR
jgi:positive regulator of sigma E activity